MRYNICDNNILRIEGDIKRASEKELRLILRQVPKYFAVIAKNQNLDMKSLQELGRKLGGSDLIDENLFHNEKSTPSVIRVTNERKQNGDKLGIFEDQELGWHCNGASRKKVEESTLILYCQNPGDPLHGITSFCNMNKAYKELPDDLRFIVDDIDIHICFETFSGNTKTLHQTHKGYQVSKNDTEYLLFTGTSNDQSNFIKINEEFYKPLVHQHPWHGEKSLNFIPSGISRWRSRSNIEFDSELLWKTLNDHCFKNSNIYRHQWEAGDLLFNDQWYFLHKRTQTKGSRSMLRLCVKGQLLSE